MFFCNTCSEVYLEKIDVGNFIWFAKEITFLHCFNGIFSCFFFLEEKLQENMFLFV